MLRVFLFCFIIFDVAIQSVIDVLIKFYVNECGTRSVIDVLIKFSDVSIVSLYRKSKKNGLCLEEKQVSCS